jgi:hypothetical protein
MQWVLLENGQLGMSYDDGRLALRISNNIEETEKGVKVEVLANVGLQDSGHGFLTRIGKGPGILFPGPVQLADLSLLAAYFKRSIFFVSTNVPAFRV